MKNKTNIMKNKIDISKITNIVQVIIAAKPTVGEKTLISYKGKDRSCLRAKYFTLITLIARVFNEGWIADYSNPNEPKWFPLFYFDTKTSAFVYYDTAYCYYGTDGGVPAHALKSQELAIKVGRDLFKDIYVKHYTV